MSMNDYGQIDDGFGSVWPRCKPDCQLEIVRPGKVQCECDDEGSPEDDEAGMPAFADTCCGKCPGDTCYVDQMTGA